MPTLLDATAGASVAEAVARAAELLRAGELVAFPTETVYGLGARADLRDAVLRLYRAKGRPADHPVIVHLRDASHLDAWAEEVPGWARMLTEATWPGPLTLVVRARPSRRGPVTAHGSTVAVRVPGDPLALRLLSALDADLAAPSANRFGRVSPTTAQHVLDEFPDEASEPSPVAAVLDGGPCTHGLESTIVDATGPEPRQLRPGAVARRRLEELLGRPVPAGADDGPRAPGTLPRHYAPTLPTRVVGRAELERAPADVAVVAPAAAPGRTAARWSLPDDPAGYGRALYAALREAQASGAREIWLAPVPDDDAWAAVADRIRRATETRATREPLGEEAP